MESLVPEGWFMILLQDMCRDPSGGQFLTTTDAPSIFALVRLRKGEV